MEAESRYHSGAARLAPTRPYVAGPEDIGMCEIGVSEAGSGTCVGAAEEALIVIGLGRRLAPPADLATIGAAHARLETDAIDLRGRRVAAAYRRGERIIIVEDSRADLVLVRDHDSAALHELTNASPVSVDHHLWLSHLRTATSLGEPIARLDARQVLLLRLLDAAALAGIAEATLDMSVAHLGRREQPGRLGGMQSVKQHCASMAIAARCARDQISFAAFAIDEQREDAALQVDSALFVAGTAALENAAKNIQIHNALGGPRAESDPHLYLKRAQLLVAIAGGLDATNRRVADV